MTKLLIVEDDENLRITLADNLELENYQVLVAQDLAEAKEVLVKESVDLIILDIMLPDGDGYTFAKELRGSYPHTFILMLTARTLEQDVLDGFESGADDYVSKPYRMKELLMRIKALLRRKHNDIETEIIEINGFKINWKTRQVSYQKKELHLTKKEFELLNYLYSKCNQVQSRDDILKSVWGEDIYIDNRTVDNFISIIKSKLNLNIGSNYYIKSVRSVGYCFIKSDSTN